MQDDDRDEEAQYDEETADETADETQDEGGDAEADDTGDSDDGAEHDGGGDEDPTDDDAGDDGEESDDGAEHDGGGDEDPTDDDADADADADAGDQPGPSDRSRPRPASTGRSSGQASSGHARGDGRPTSTGHARPAPSSSAAPPLTAHRSIAQLHADVAERRRLARFSFKIATHDSVLFLWAVLAYKQHPTQSRGQFLLDWFLQPTRCVWPLNVPTVDADLPRVSAHAHSVQANAFAPFEGAVRNNINGDVLERFFSDKSPPPDPARGSYAAEYKQFIAAAKKAGFTLHELGLD